MKNIVIASAAAALMTVSGAAIAQERVFASTDLNVRAGPGTNHRVVGSIGPNDPATLRDCSGNWCRISYGGGEGWVSSRYLVEGGEERFAGRPGSGTATGVATGVIGGALIGGPVGAVVGGVAGGAIGAGADAAGERGRNVGLGTGAATGAIGGAIIGGPVGAVVGGLAGGAIGAGTDAATRGVDRMETGSIAGAPSHVPPGVRVSHTDADGRYGYVWHGGQYLKVETDTGRVIGLIR